MLNTKQNAKRKKILGDIGEEIAIEFLTRNGYNYVENLNKKQNNHPFVDLKAEKNGNQYIISVKTRNKYQYDGKINPIYNLNNFEKHYNYLKTDSNVITLWLAIQYDEKLNNASFYLGNIDNLINTGHKGIPVKKIMSSSLKRDESIELILFEENIHLDDKYAKLNLSNQFE